MMSQQRPCQHRGGRWRNVVIDLGERSCHKWCGKARAHVFGGAAFMNGTNAGKMRSISGARSPIVDKVWFHDVIWSRAVPGEGGRLVLFGTIFFVIDM